MLSNLSEILNKFFDGIEQICNVNFSFRCARLIQMLITFNFFVKSHEKWFKLRIFMIYFRARSRTYLFNSRGFQIFNEKCQAFKKY